MVAVVRSLAISQQRGLTLLEVLIALSIFALIGVTSFRVLSSVIDSQQAGDGKSRQLAQFQKALTIIDRDLLQLINRTIRIGPGLQSNYLQINTGQYAIEFSRAGRSNPLKLSRSALQRVAYDIGRHPEINDPASEHYRSQRKYLRRHYWSTLDRQQDAGPRTQLLLADIDTLQVSAITDRGRRDSWPITQQTAAAAANKPRLQAVEFSFSYPVAGVLTRLYQAE